MPMKPASHEWTPSPKFNHSSAPVVLEPEATPSVTAPESAVEILHGSIIIRLDAGTQADRIAEIAHALSARA